MNRNEFKDHLDKDVIDQETFTLDEIDEVILTVFNILEWCIRDGADTIVVSNKQVVWRSGQNTVGKLPTILDFNPSFEKVLIHDEIIRAHLKLVNRIGDKVIYKLDFT